MPPTTVPALSVCAAIKLAAFVELAEVLPDPLNPSFVAAS
jgi:hypothetical protein